MMNYLTVDVNGCSGRNGRQQEHIVVMFVTVSVGVRVSRERVICFNKEWGAELRVQGHVFLVQFGGLGRQSLGGMAFEGSSGYSVAVRVMAF